MSLNISKHLDKNNLHHAYLLEGEREKIIPELLSFFEEQKIKTSGNPDFCQIQIDSLKIDEAFGLRHMSSDKAFSSSKKIFLISINNSTLDAQNVLLKMFEEPIANTHFFLIVPDTNILLKTLISRFYLISTVSKLATTEAEAFINMSLPDRIDFIKVLLAAPEDEQEDLSKDSVRSKALKFLNSLESVLHNKLFVNYADGRFTLKEGGKSNNLQVIYYEHLFKVRKFLRMPGSSAKSLMESVALITPNY